MERRTLSRGGVYALLGLLAAGCGSAEPREPGARPAWVGREPVPEVHLYESNASALVAWRRAGARDRVLVHLDSGADLGWLPDDAVARIAASTPVELVDLERHPLSVHAAPHEGFGPGDFVYPAVRLGIVREMYWVVPDGTLRTAGGMGRLARDRILARIQRISLAEGTSMEREDGRLSATLLDLPVTVVELADLPAIDEPVLLDIDLHFFAPADPDPWMPRVSPNAVVEALAERGVRTDLATVSLSTMGGQVPVGCRWIGHALEDLLRRPGGGVGLSEAEVAEIRRASSAGSWKRVTAVIRRWVRRDPDEAAAWYLLARALERTGGGAEAATAAGRARSIDPILEHRDLLEADRLRGLGRCEEAVGMYRRYIGGGRESDGFRLYAMRREAGCLRRLGRLDEAVAGLERVLQSVPTDCEGHFELGLALRHSGRPEEAVEAFTTARRLTPHLATYALALGTTQLMIGHVEDGVKNLEDAVDLSPCWPAARANLAHGLARLGRYHEAASHLRAGLSFHPRQPGLRELASELDRRGVEITPVRALPFD